MDLGEERPQRDRLDAAGAPDERALRGQRDPDLGDRRVRQSVREAPEQRQLSAGIHAAVTFRHGASHGTTRRGTTSAPGSTWPEAARDRLAAGPRSSTRDSEVSAPIGGRRSMVHGSSPRPRSRTSPAGSKSGHARRSIG